MPHTQSIEAGLQCSLSTSTLKPESVNGTHLKFLGQINHLILILAKLPEDMDYLMLLQYTLLDRGSDVQQPV